eukprot:s7855_g7.t1
MGRNTICCHQFVLDCQRWEEGRFVATSLCSIVKDGKKYDLLPPVCAQRWEEVRFVATSLCSIVKDGKKYDLLPPVCGARLSKMGRSTICCHQFGLKDGKKYNLLPPVCGARLSKMGTSTFCCHQLAVLDCQRCEKVRCFATSLRCSIVKDGKNCDLLPPVCARLSKMGRSMICCHQFVLDCQRWEDVRFVATSLCEC